MLRVVVVVVFSLNLEVRGKIPSPQEKKSNSNKSEEHNARFVLQVAAYKCEDKTIAPFIG